MAERLYSQGEVNRIFPHIRPKTSAYWAKVGLLRWSGEDTDGRGMHRQFAQEDLYLIGLVEELASENIPLSKIKEIVDDLVKQNTFSGKPQGQTILTGALTPSFHDRFLLIWKDVQTGFIFSRIFSMTKVKEALSDEAFRTASMRIFDLERIAKRVNAGIQAAEMKP